MDTLAPMVTCGERYDHRAKPGALRVKEPAGEWCANRSLWVGKRLENAKVPRILQGRLLTLDRIQEKKGPATGGKVMAAGPLRL